MIKTLFQEKYDLKLIKLMMESSFLGVLISNLLGPVASVYILSAYINHNVLYIWLSLHIVLLVSRISLKSILDRLISENSTKVNKYFTIVNSLIFLTTVLYGYMVWKSVLLDVPSLNVFVLGIIIFSLSAGSISTLGPVFRSFLIYLVFNFLFLISALLYHGGDMFYMFALTMSVMMITLIFSARAYFENIKNGISLNESIHAIYENSSDGVVIIKNNKFFYPNKSVLEMFKVPSRELFLKTSVKTFIPEYQPDGSDSFRKMTKMMSKAMQNDSIRFEWLHYDYNGKELWCEIVLTKIRLDGQDVLHGVWRDISERKKTHDAERKHKKEIELLNASLEERIKVEVNQNMIKDRQMLQQSRLAQMGEMIAMIAHQWRQPLSAISASSAILHVNAELDSLENDSVIETSNKINKLVKHLSSTIDDFRNFFKSNKKEELTTYTRVVDSVLGIIQSSLESKGIKVILELECEDEFVSYVNELKQVLINLITNSQDALLENEVKEPYIKIKTYVLDEKYILEVSDNGGGIKSEIIDQVFDPYFSTRLNKDGTGLGLYMSKLIMENHCRGKLSCENRDDGVCFIMELNNAQQ